MAYKIDIKKDIYNQSVRKKKQKKIRYDKGVKGQYFTPGNFVFLKNSISNFEKLTKQ